MKLSIPAEFTQLNSMPEDPPHPVTYGKQTESSMCLLMIYPIDHESAMPYDEAAIIDGVHRGLVDVQGLIEVGKGITSHQKRYVYHIVKSKLEPSGIQYALCMHIDRKDDTLAVQAFFDEIGMTGLRDSMVMSAMMDQGILSSSDMDGWFQDPYDEQYTKGLLMNASEQAEFDELFPDHPLSETRRLVQYIVEHN